MHDRQSLGTFAWRVVVAVALVAGLWVAWRIADLLFLVFGGLVLSFPLRRLAEKLAGWSRLPHQVAVAVVALLIVVLGGLGMWRFGTEIGALSGDFYTALLAAFREAEAALRQYPVGNALIEEVQRLDIAALIPGGFMARVTGFASTVLMAISAVVLLAVLALYFAASPALYRRGAEWLAPPRLRPQWCALMDAMGHSLWGWLRGQLISMAIIGVMTTGMLWALGVPMAVPLGLIAFFFEFVPFIGPIAAALPALLIAFTQGTETMLWVLLGYVLIQQIENNVVMPLIYQHEVFLPPVLTVATTVAFGLLFGIVGLLFATPVVVVVYAATRRLLRWRDEEARAVAAKAP